jgi:hypothetical protein
MIPPVRRCQLIMQTRGCRDRDSPRFAVPRCWKLENRIVPGSSGEITRGHRCSCAKPYFSSASGPLLPYPDARSCIQVRPE